MPLDGISGASEASGQHFHALGKNVVLKYLSETSEKTTMVFVVIALVRSERAGDVTVLITIGSAVALLIGDLGINVTTIAGMSGAVESDLGCCVRALFWKNAISMVALTNLHGPLLHAER